MLSPRNGRFIALILAFVVAFITLHFLTQPAGAQSAPKAGPSPSPKAEPPKPKSDDYSKEAVVIEDLRTAYRFEKDGTGQRELSLRVKVQSEAGLERFGQLVFPYSSANEKLDVDYVRVKKVSGDVVNAPLNEIQDLTGPVAREAPIYTDLREKHVTVPGLRPGDVLEYHVVWNIHTPLAPNHFWLNHDFVSKGVIVLSDQLAVNVPGDSKIKLKTEPGFEPTISEKDGRRIYSWKHSNLKLEDNEDKDNDKDSEDKEDKKAEEIDPDEVRPDVQLTTFQSWDEVGQWYASLQRDRIVPDEKIKARAQEIIQQLTGDKAKIQALYEFVAKNFRYVSLSLGQGRYQPHAASDVFSNQYGDCKDKHTLLASMLDAAGLRAYPVLMNSSRKIDAEMPSPGQFDHVISAIPLGNETLWADTTAEVAPFGLLSPRLRDKKALMIPVNGPAHLETTPAEPPFASSEVSTLEGEVSDLGKLTARSHLTLHGDAEMFMRLMFRRTPQSNWKNLGYYLSMSSGVRGEVSDIKPSDPAELSKPFEVEYSVKRDDFLDWSTKKLKLEVPLPSIRLRQPYGRRSESTKPIEIGPPIDITYSLKLSLPAKYKVRLPLPLKVSRDYGDYVASYRLDGNTLIAERTLHLRRRELPANRLEDYQAFIAAAKADEGQSLSLETEIAGTPAIPETVKTEELLQAAESASKNGNFVVAEQLLKRVLEKDPKHKYARRFLGYAYTEQRKFPEAIEILREQTKINAFDDYAYNLLGRIYWRQLDYANAEGAFRKQLEITPLDATAHANLGTLLVEWRKYKDAIPELEQAISLAPEREMLHVSLGRAYLNLGETQKGIASFEEAIKLSPKPLVWNDVAYFLAVKGVQLDRAQQYAESAVTAIGTSLRNLETANISLDDLRNVSSLAAYWDTLGWVYFQKGDIDTAEKYITAGWMLQQHSEVGHHLGMIAEKRGKKEEAIRFYALAVVADREVPEARESLLKLTPASSVEALLKTAKAELPSFNLLKLDHVTADVKQAAEADYFVVFAPDGAKKAQVLDVKFISGDETLKASAAQLKSSIRYNLVFPDSAPTKLVRRGTLRCPVKGSCTFTMVSPDDVTAVD